MATINIKIDPGAAVKVAGDVSRAVRGIGYAATAANTSINILEASLQTFATKITAHNSLIGSGMKTLNSSVSKTAYVVNESSKSMESRLNAVGVAATGNLRTLTSESNKANTTLEKLPRTFVNIEKSASGGIGSITRFFGQVAIGVFLVGELVMIFTALAKAIAALNFKSPVFDDIAYQFEVLKTQVRDIIEDVTKSFSGSILESFEALNKWIAQNKGDIVEFITDTVKAIQNFYNLAKDIVEFFAEHEDIFTAGVLAYFIIGKGKRGAGLATLVIAEKILRTVLAISEASAAVHEGKTTWGEIFEGAGGIAGTTADLEKFLDKMDLLNGKDTGKNTIRESIRLANIELQELNDKLKETEKLLFQGTSSSITGGGRSINQSKLLAERHAQYDPIIAEIQSKIDEKKKELNKLQAEKNKIDPVSPDADLKKIQGTLKDIYQETGIATADYIKVLTDEENKRHSRSLALLKGQANEEKDIWAERINHEMKLNEIVNLKTAGRLKIYEEAAKTTKHITEEHYNLLVERENSVHRLKMMVADTYESRMEETRRHTEELHKINIRAGKEQLEMDKRRLELSKSEISFDGKTQKDILDEMFPEHDKAIKVAQDLNLMETAWISVVETFNNATPEKKREDIFKIFFGDHDRVINALQAQQKEWLELQGIFDETDLGPFTKLWEELSGSFDDFQSAYTRITGLTTEAWFTRQVGSLEALRKKIEEGGKNVELFRDIYNKLLTDLKIKKFESNDDFGSGLLAALMRFGEQAETTSKVVSDVFLEAFNEIENAFVNNFDSIFEDLGQSWKDALGGMADWWMKFMRELAANKFKSVIKELLEGPSGDTSKQSVSGIKGLEGGIYGIGAKTQYDEVTGMPIGTTGGIGKTGGAVIMSAATLVGIYEQAKNAPSKAEGAAMGAVSGALAGAYIGSLYPGIGTLIGAAIGAVVGGVAGYLASEGAAEKAKLQAQSGNLVNRGDPFVTTPFGKFGFDVEKIADSSQYKGAMDSVQKATQKLFILMGDDVAASVKTAVENWSSETAHGDMAAEDIENMIEKYFQQIGSAWESAIGNFLANFVGTFDQLTQAIDIMAEVEQSINPKSDYELSVMDTKFHWQENYDILKELGMGEEYLGLVRKAEASDLKRLADEEQERARRESEQAAAEAKRAADEKAANLKSIKDILRSSGDMIGLYTELENQIYNTDTQFEVWIQTMTDAGASAKELAIVTTNWGIAIDKVKESALNNIKELKFTILYSLGYISEFENGLHTLNLQFDSWIEQMKDWGATPEEIQAIEDLRPGAEKKYKNKFKEDTAQSIYDIGIESGHMVGIFNDLQYTVYGINQTFSGFNDELVRLEAPVEKITENTRRWGIAIDQAAREFNASINMLAAGLPGINKSLSKEFNLAYYGSKYGGGIDQRTVDMFYKAAIDAARAGMSKTDAQNYLDSIFPNMGITVDEFYQDLGTLYEIFHPMQEAVNGTTGALDNMKSALEATLKSIQGAISGIDDLIWELTGGQYAPVQSLEGFEHQYRKLFDPIATSDDPNAAFGEFSGFLPGMIDFMGAFGGYKDWNSSVVSDLQGLRGTLVDREQTLNLRLEVVITQDGKSMGAAISNAVVVNASGVTDVLANALGNILSVRMNKIKK